jgi:hypothetical protein
MRVKCATCGLFDCDLSQIDAEIQNAIEEIRKAHGVPPHILGKKPEEEGVDISEFIPDDSPPLPEGEWWRTPNPDGPIADLDDNLHYTAGVPDEIIPPPEPVAPEGVTLHFKNGRSQKVELVYIGVSDNPGGQGPLHTWEVTTHPNYQDVARIEIEMMPPMTQIHIGGPGGP